MCHIYLISVLCIHRGPRSCLTGRWLLYPQIKRVVGTANSAGHWSVQLGLLGSGLVASGPFTLTASRPGYTITRRDILVGEVRDKIH